MKKTTERRTSGPARITLLAAVVLIVGAAGAASAASAARADHGREVGLEDTATRDRPSIGVQPRTLTSEQKRAIDRIFEPWDRPESPGCAVGVALDGQLAYARGYGSANLERGTPLTPRSVFYLASVTKQFTSAAVTRLALEGRISLDEEVRTYVPELPEYSSPVRIRHLLHNISGIRDYLDLMRVEGLPFGDVYTKQDILRLITRQGALNFEPGSRYLYSNSNFFLLSIIVERVTDLSLREYAERHFFEPLGMEDTHFHDDHTREIPNRVLGYGPDDDGGFVLTHLPNTDWTGSGAGNLHSTVEDLARWDGNLLDPVVGSRQWVDTTYTRGILSDGDTIGYAFGVQVSEFQGLRVARHGGGWMGFRNHYLRFPDHGAGVVTLCNLGSIDAGRLAERVATVVLQDEIEGALGPMVGVYRSEDTAVDFRIDVREGNLLLHREPKGDSALLRPTDEPGRYTTEWLSGEESGEIELRFTRDTGEVTGLIVNTGRARGIRFRMEDHP